MLKIFTYEKIPEDITFPILLEDHLGGFDIQLNNDYFKILDDYAESKNLIGEVYTNYLFDDSIKVKYKNLEFKLYFEEYLNDLRSYTMHPENKFENFISCFNGAKHVSRQLLTSILNNQGLFNKTYCSKNFTTNNDEVTSHLNNFYLDEKEVRLYEKFFLNDDEFNKNNFSFGYNEDFKFDHDKNIFNIENIITKSFLNIVSETMATSYYPFITEKFLYSVVTRGLFLSYAQPNWHKQLVRMYGFRLYDKVFDYSFDEILNPVKRLIKLLDSITRFQFLSINELNDLYEMEKETIEFNYSHYFSGEYQKNIMVHT